MSRLQTEKDYWNKNALDPDVDIKYISDVPTEDCLKDLLPLKGKILDLGCGVGRLTPTQQWGADISENMLKIARKRRSDCMFDLLDSAILPYPNNFFNVVFSYLLIQHLKPETIKQYLSEANRILKNGGSYKLQFIEGTEREPYSNHYSKDELTSWALEAGFKKVLYKKSVAYNGWTIAKAIK